MNSNPKSRLHSSTDLAWLMEMLEVGEEDLVSLALSALSPYQPGSLRQKLQERQKKAHRDPDAVPSPDELWRLFVSADFRCTLAPCRSQLSVTIDRIDSKKGYEIENMRVLCRDCNRQTSRPGSTQKALKMKIFGAVRQCLASDPQHFPSDMDVKRKAQVRDLSGSLYLVRFLRSRWAQRRRQTFPNEK